MTDIDHELSITGHRYCGGCGQNWPCQHERLRAENERLHQALCDVQFDLINCSQAAGSGACEHLTDAIAIVTRTLAPPDR